MFTFCLCQAITWFWSPSAPTPQQQDKKTYKPGENRVTLHFFYITSTFSKENWKFAAGGSKGKSGFPLPGFLSWQLHQPPPATANLLHVGPTRQSFAPHDYPLSFPSHSSFPCAQTSREFTHTKKRKLLVLLAKSEIPTEWKMPPTRWSAVPHTPRTAKMLEEVWYVAVVWQLSGGEEFRGTGTITKGWKENTCKDLYHQRKENRA